ncbi:TetR/AcrR family transcriptional regulator [Streptomyces longispororuber]|uniref:TetR/AcrR family transcriptional regulator n=1 Tax=Streptomyces longispororuber TaxID=68230 RepID=UPI00210EF5D8|nr:TetR family transcriptional regulator [Streptomyces longispororuber]MCQ4212484.1 TetR family transcriptional regulator [Streptomyces longispororuber]
MNESPSSPRPQPAARRRGRPAGRRAGDTVTRDRILDAARLHFAQGTYATTTVRAIAAEADVNPALVLHYFGSKRDLFAATLRLPFDLREQVAALIRDDPDDLGEQLVRAFLRVWQDPISRHPLAAMIRSVVSDQDAADALGQFFSVQMVGPLVAASGRDQPHLRVSLVVSHLIGLVMGRYILGVAPLAKADLDHLVACMAPVVQHYLTGPLPHPAHQPARR